LSEHKITILTIDDEASIRQSFRFYLEDLGYTVLEAENGRRGLEIIAREELDLVLVDLRMPEVSGLEVLVHLKEKNPELPVIVVSGTGMIGDAIETLRLGAWDYLIKPISDLEVLKHAIDKALDRARLLHENQQYQPQLEDLVKARTLELEQANTELHQINQRLHRIVESTKALAACSQVAQFGDQLLREFARQMAASGGSLYLVEESGLRLISALDPGHAVQFIEFPLRPGSVLSKLLEESKPVLIRNEEDWSGLNSSDWTGYGSCSALAFPIQTKDNEVIGLLSLHTKQDAPFTEQDKDIGVILASYSCEVLRSTRATEMLAGSEARYRELVESMVIGVMLCGLDRRIHFANHQAGQILDTDPAQLLNHRLDDFIAPGDATQLTALIAETASTGIQDHELPVVLRNGEQKLLSVHTTRSSQSEDETKRTMLTFQDITQLRMLEEQLHQAQKMDALGILAGGIAHDFNNILFAILGNASLAQAELDPDANPRVYLDEIIQAGQRASDLVKQILSFARQTDIQRVPLMLAPVVKESLKLMRSTLPANIEIVQHFWVPDAMVIGDATQVHQVLMNLCTNANHAMLETGGILTVEVNELSVAESDAERGMQLAPGHYIELAVTDTGTGIDPEILPRIFDPFFTTKDTASGTGMGLSVVHGIITQMGGTITVTSQPGEKTAFKVYLPKVDTTASVRMKGGKAEIPTGTERILLVDDEPSLCAMISKILENLGYQVTALNSSPAALETFRHNPNAFDLVLTDQAMPRLTGAQLAVEIQAVRSNTPIILCTGYSEVLKPEEARRLGIDEYLYKPVATYELAATVRRVLDSHQV